MVPVSLPALRRWAWRGKVLRQRASLSIVSTLLLANGVSLRSSDIRDGKKLWREANSSTWWCRVRIEPLNAVKELLAHPFLLLLLFFR